MMLVRFENIHLYFGLFNWIKIKEFLVKKIICYRDSNTFGLNPKEFCQYDENTRWTSLLQKKLAVEYKVINEGMCNRTGFVDNPDGKLYSAKYHLPEVLSKIDEIHLLILAIGTNDLQFQYNVDFSTIENGLENLIKLSKEKTNNIIIISPTILKENILNSYFGSMFDEKSIEKSKQIGKIYERIANRNHCIYFDINEFVRTSDVDGLHYDENSHKIIAEKLYGLINEK